MPITAAVTNYLAFFHERWYIYRYKSAPKDGLGFNDVEFNVFKTEKDEYFL